jgi:hypothetical protein
MHTSRSRFSIGPEPNIDQRGLRQQIELHHICPMDVSAQNRSKFEPQRSLISVYSIKQHCLVPIRFDDSRVIANEYSDQHDSAQYGRKPLWGSGETANDADTERCEKVGDIAMGNFKGTKPKNRQHTQYAKTKSCTKRVGLAQREQNRPEPNTNDQIRRS